MTILVSLLAGIVSSIAAVLVIELYRFLRRRYGERWLRATLEPVGDRCAIISPVFPNTDRLHSSGLLTTQDAFAIGHLLEAYGRIGVVPILISSRQFTDDIPGDQISVGGPSGNDVTGFYLKKYCPGFLIRGGKEEGGNHRTTYYECGKRTFVDGTNDAYAFVVRLAAADTGLSGNVILCWGHSGMGTAAAAYLIAQHPLAFRNVQPLYFFGVLVVNRSLGYRSFVPRILDIGAEALQFTDASEYE